ncbi:MAG: prepilin-type N-terminal cleavage/methylation domain-containing protein, partial [Synergistaceae bacterium]|nr:prepilin-type N-terminal cleavage/methylation domain-containing protein [Synergistaceae bacterium]
MRRSKGFSLIELMTAMVVYGIFLVMLAGSFYALTSFATRSQQVLLARERGRKVIDYIDQRIRTAGLGMWDLENYKQVHAALKPLAGNPDKRTSKTPEE